MEWRKGFEGWGNVTSLVWLLGLMAFGIDVGQRDWSRASAILLYGLHV
jgi:hypothetical protein